MLCPNCKNEKWNEDTCPQCGLDQKTALLNQGDLYQKEGRNLEAVKFYEQTLLLNPEDWDVLRKRAIGLYSAALSAGNKALFDKAEEALTQALEKEWNWEQGHQFRINLFYDFGNLKEMQQAYTRTSQQNPGRKEMAEKILKIIHLTEKFAQAQSEPSAPSAAQELSKWLLPGALLSIPFWLWILWRFLYPADPKNAPSGSVAIFTSIAAVLLCVGLIFLALIFSPKKEKNTKKPRESELRLPPV
jgi:tetratricopeptide (TPR) repeat protein